MQINYFSFLILFTGFWFSAVAQQECSLAIGVTDSNTIIQIFQLKDEQIEKLEEFKAALQIETNFLDEERKDLFENHPQSTPEDLTTLGAKYKVLEDKMKQVFTKYDLKLLILFNQNQYRRYVTLCEEVSREPLVIVSE